MPRDMRGGRAWLKLSHIPFVLYDEYNGDVAEWSKAPHC